MKRSRSALSRHRKQKLLDATAHVSAAPELSIVAALAGAASLSPLASGNHKTDGDDDIVASTTQQHHHHIESVNQVIQVLRNVKNSVYHRAMAARALGLLMLQEPSLVVRLGLESEDLLDALLQLINCCRRFKTSNSDTRRVHVNCCLVISLLMRATHQNQNQRQQHQQLVVSLDSELLAMPPRPSEESSGFLLLTVSGRPETSADDQHLPGSAHGRRTDANERMPLKPIRATALPPPSTNVQSPGKQKAGKQKQALYPVGDLHKDKSPLSRDEDDQLAAAIASRQTPIRQFKMDRFRVITPSMVLSTGSGGPRSHSPSTKPFPVIPPSRSQSRHHESSQWGSHQQQQSPPTTNQLGNSPRSQSADVPSSPSLPSPVSLLNAHHMVEIFRTGRMPVASPGYFHQHLRDDDANSAGTGKATPSRLKVVEWAEWRRRGLDSDHEQVEEQDTRQSEEQTKTPPRPPRDHAHHTRHKRQTNAARPLAAMENIHTPEYKRERLREILSSPIEPSERNTANLLALDNRVSTTTMAVLDAELTELRDSEARTRQELRTRVEQERDKLPLKFLFQLPGGAAYCRNRMRRAMLLWVHEFEANQKRMALLQLKGFVEQCRYRLRGQEYHRLAIEKRLKVAIEYVLRNYQQQALTKWVATIREAIWLDRDAAIRKIQRQVRRRFGLLRFLRLHDAHPVGGPVLRDVYLALPRDTSLVSYRIPLRVRQERRCIWHAAEFVQGIYRKRRFRVYLKRFRVAATKIQARARMRIARAHYRLMKKRIILLQACVRMQHHYRIYRTLRNAVILVQVNFRSVRMKRMRQLVLQAQRRAQEWRLTGALTIQRAVRGFLARCDARRRQFEREERFHAALVVQRAWYRRNNEWSTFLLLGCLREKEKDEVSFDKEVWALKRKYMAKQIRHAWKRHRHRCQTKAASLVQRNLRRWLAKRFVHQLRMEKMAHRRIKWFFRFRHAVRIRMATKLQFWWLRAVPWRLVEHLRWRRVEMEAVWAQEKYKAHNHAAICIQSVARGKRDRSIAKRERSARVIQKGARSFIVWRRIKHEIRRIKRIIAQQQANEWVSTATQRVFGAKMKRFNGAVTEIQRIVRGCLWRTRLTRAMVREELRERVARRIQLLWRQNAQQRVAKSVMNAQRRRRVNPFNALASVSRVLREMTTQASALYDPQDELQGIHVAAWLRRLGLPEDKYAPIFLSGAMGGLQQLRASGDADSCRTKLEELGVEDDDDLQVMVTNLMAAQTRRDVKRVRNQLESLRSAQRRDEKLNAFGAQQLRHAQEARDHITEQLEDVLNEARDFRNPPKALRAKRESLATQLDHAQQTVASIKRKHDSMEKGISQRKVTIARCHDELSTLEKDDVSASYSLQNFRLVGQLSVARELFLSKFPGLEARALAFVGALEENQVTTWQLLKFFRVNATISQVKASMATLTYCQYATEIKKHDHARYQACGDLLQFGFERIGEIVGLSLDDMVLLLRPSSSSSVGHQVAHEDLGQMVLTVMNHAQRCRQVRERAVVWNEGAQSLRKMDAVATRVQSQWRRRAANRMVLMLRSNRLKKQLQDDYLAEVQADYVTPIWQADRDKEKKELEQWMRDEERAAREEVLHETLRFPWEEEWDDDSQCWVVLKLHAELGREYAVDERPVYSVEEEDAVVVMQSLVRRFLARMELHEREREKRRELKRVEMETKWLTKADERAQNLTLRVKINVAADERVALWIGRRQQQQQKRETADAAPQLPSSSKTSSVSPTKARRKNAVQKEEEEKKRLRDAASIEAVQRELATSHVLDQCETAYHRSVRSEHRRHVLFPIKSRPLNIHAQAMVLFMDAAQQLQRALAPKIRTESALEYTRVALPFGWQESTAQAGQRPYFYHLSTQQTSWDRPQYSFDHEYAAIKMQSLARVVVAQAAKAQAIEEISFVDTVHTAIKTASQVGWVGYGLEGISVAVFLSRLGLAKYNATPVGSLSMDAVLRLPEAKLKKLGWTKEEITTITSSAPPRAPPRKRPLTSCLVTLPPTTKHPFNFLPSERVVQQLVAQSLPNQQGRVIGLVRAVTQSTTPISYRQLEMHLRMNAGRPDDAVAQIHEIASLSYATQPPQEKQILEVYLRCLERCVVFAKVLALQGLHEELSVTMRTAAFLLTQPHPDADAMPGSSGATQLQEQQHHQGKAEETMAALLEAGVLASPATPLATDRSLASSITNLAETTRRHTDESPVHGMWEHDAKASGTPLSAGQVALFLRAQGLERVLLWWRSTAICQATYRMHKVREWYRSVVAYRRYSATLIQCAWRSYGAMEMKRLLESQQRSPYEQRYDKMTKSFFFVYTPTSEKLLDEPRDARGDMLPYRPMVQDRVTKRWLQAWPHLGDKINANAMRDTRDESENGGASPCSICHVERAVRRCNECYSASGDYVDFCLACFYDRHETTTSELSWHTFQPMHQMKIRAFHCVECKRFSTMRCLTCHEQYCERCFLRVHRKGHMRVRHTVEHYDAMAAVCVECEARVAFQLCLVCQDALCENCMARTHEHGTKQSHALKLIKQQQVDVNAAGHVYCEQCHARRGDATCEFCAMALCQLCLVDPSKHAVTCLEAQLALKKKELLGDRLCVECHKPADRKCGSCGDNYCSVKWMGNAGCFERFHWKGKRADHVYTALDNAPPEMPHEIVELEEKVKQKRRKDAQAAEQEAKEMAVALAAAAALELEEAAKIREAEAVKARRRNRKNQGRKSTMGASTRKLLGSAASRVVCSVEECGKPTLSAAVPFCGAHLTSQHALDVMKEDPLEAAKLLALVERHGGKLPSVSDSDGLWKKLSRMAAAQLHSKKNNKKKKNKTPREDDEKVPPTSEPLEKTSALKKKKKKTANKKE